MKYLIPILVIAGLIYFSYWFFNRETTLPRAPVTNIKTEPVTLPLCKPNQVSVDVDGKKLCECGTFTKWAEGVWLCVGVK